MQSADTYLAMAVPKSKSRASFRRRSKKARQTSVGYTEEDESVPSLDFQTAEVRKLSLLAVFGKLSFPS